MTRPRPLVSAFLFALTVTIFVAWGMAQDNLPVPRSPLTSTLPRLIRLSGVLHDSAGNPVGNIAGVTFSIYDKEDGTSPIWLESQSVTADETGKYTILLGSTKAEGLPASIFASGEARWIGVQVEGQAEQSRTLLVSVPYALKAADADTLGGKPLSAFLLADSNKSSSGSKAQRLQDSSAANRETTGNLSTGTANTSPNFLTKFDSGTSIVNSSVFENALGQLGLGTTNPTAKIHIVDGSNANITLQALYNNGPAFEFKNAAAVPADWFFGVPGSANGNSFFVYDQANGNIPFEIEWGAKASSFKIKNSGFVGIGTSSPASKLHIADATSANLTMQSLNNNGPAINFKNAAAAPADWFLGVPGSTNGNSFFLYDNAGGHIPLQVERGAPDNQLILRSTGNVGIGTAAPLSKFHIFDPTNANVIVQSGNNGGPALNFKNSAAVPADWFLGVPGSINGNSFFLYDNGTGRIPLQIERGALDNSLLIKSSGNVGIGNPAPSAKLDVSQTIAGSGSFSIGAPPPSAIHGDVNVTTGFITGVLGTTSSVDGFGLLGENLASGQGTGHSAGVRGITANTTTLGTGVWGDALQASGDNVGVFGHSASTAGTGVEGFADATTGDAIGVYGVSSSTGGTGVFGEVTAATAASSSLFPAGIYGKIASNAGTAGLFDTTSTGSILLGRAGSTPVNVFRVDSAGKGFFNGGTQTGGADFAESVSVLEERIAYQPGDVMAIDTTGVRRFAKVAKPYSTLVAGVYSTKPGVLATPYAADDPRPETEEIPLAMVGIVPCKVSSENGFINAGDLLVSSSKSGYAMKGTDRSRMTGAVIGKALQSMHAVSGVIEVLISLQ